MLFAPVASNGDFTEYKHRHFPVVYAFISIYSLGYAAKLIKSMMSTTEWLSQRLHRLIYSMLTILMAISAYCVWNKNLAQPDTKSIPWAKDYHNQVLRPGILEVSNFLTDHAVKGNVMATGVSSPSASAITADPRCMFWQ
jgi:hypothetical protein